MRLTRSTCKERAGLLCSPAAALQPACRTCQAVAAEGVEHAQQEAQGVGPVHQRILCDKTVGHPSHAVGRQRGEGQRVQVLRKQSMGSTSERVRTSRRVQKLAARACGLCERACPPQRSDKVSAWLSPQARARYEPAAPPCRGTRTAPGLLTKRVSQRRTKEVGFCTARRQQPAKRAPQQACNRTPPTYAAGRPRLPANVPTTPPSAATSVCHHTAMLARGKATALRGRAHSDKAHGAFAGQRRRRRQPRVETTAG